MLDHLAAIMVQDEEGIAYFSARFGTEVQLQVRSFVRLMSPIRAQKVFVYSFCILPNLTGLKNLIL